MTTPNSIRVMTVDDHEIMRGGIKFMLLAFDDLELVGEASSGAQAVEVCTNAAPDVVLMDMKMGAMDGVETTRAIKTENPDVQIIILTSFHDKKLVENALKAGAVSYVLKDASKEELAEAIRAAHRGRTTLSSEVAKDLIQASPPQPGGDLTVREREVLVLLTKGLSNKQIAKQLNRSQFTVRNHVSSIIEKLAASNRAEVAAVAVEYGLVD